MHPSSIDIVIEPRRRDLGGFFVERVLPYAKRRMVGPFIFFDVMGPADFDPGKGIDVRAHPHIGLATVTYLFSGEIRHRDSLGYDQVIKPGDVNWMTAGRGIAHSERTDDALRAAGHHLHGIQSWVALPESDEETAPAFHHYPKDTLPCIDRGDVVMHLIAGAAFGATSPVAFPAPIFYLAVDAQAGAAVPLPDDHEERAIHIVEGALEVDGASYQAGQMIVFAADAAPAIKATTQTRAMLLGGAPMGERRIWWNFVGSSQEKIDAAKAAWRDAAGAEFKNAAFTLPPDETEFIPLPDE